MYWKQSRAFQVSTCFNLFQPFKALIKQLDRTEDGKLLPGMPSGHVMPDPELHRCKRSWIDQSTS